MNVILIFITVISVGVAVYCATVKKQIDTVIQEENKKLLEENRLIGTECNELRNKKRELISENDVLINSISKEKEHLETIQNNINSTLKSQEELSSNAFEQYCKVLENEYKEKENEYDNLINTLEESYNNIQAGHMAEIDVIREELDKLRATHAAVIEAERREKEIENNLSFYCLEISDSDKADIARLEALKPSLNKPRVLSMLIWQTWFQKPLKALSANVVGLNDKTGIYKITNVKTKECYIGQAASIKDRWAEHCKCGLGIDTPAGNKLYKAIQEFGLWNFSFEVIEECPREELNKKERYYIELYSAYEYGYNSNRGNK